MSIGELSLCRSFRMNSSRSLEYPRSLERREELLNNDAAIGSARSDDTQTACIIAIAVKAHEKLLTDPFKYALHHLVKQKNHKVVVICCMSRVRSELGVDLLIDETFRGISKKKLESAMNSQRNKMIHFLRAFRGQLDEKGVQLEIHIYTGRKSDDILVKAAKKLHPHWVVLDISFAGHQNKIQAALKCDLVLMKKKKDSSPLVFQLTPKKKDLGPVDHIHYQVSEEVVSPSLGTSSPSMRIETSISTDITSRQNGASPTINTPAPPRGNNTGDTAKSSTNIKTENGYPAPPALSPARVASPSIHTPLHTERPTESRVPAPPALAWVATQSRLALRRPPSHSWVATKILPASISLSAPRLSFRTITTPPNPPSSTCRLKPAATTSSSSRTWIANPSISSPLREPIPYETALDMAINASLLPNPPNSAGQSIRGTTTSSRCRTWTGEANPSIFRPLSEPIPYETALAMAISASLLSAEEEGISVSPSAELSSSSWRDSESNMRPSDGLVPNDIITPHIALDSSILSESEEDVPSFPLIRRGYTDHVSGSEEYAPLSSSPLPENLSSCHGGQGHRGPADRSNADTDEFRGWLEGKQSSNSGWGPGSSAGARTSKFGLSIADVPSTSESSESGIRAKPTPSPTSVPVFSSHQSLTQVASPSTQHAPSAPLLPLDGPIRYPSVDTSPIHYPAAGSSDSPPTRKKANARRDRECVVCWDRPADAVCVPCGHVAGCTSCLKEIKSDKWCCPVCRVTIQQVVKIYVV